MGKESKVDRTVEQALIEFQKKDIQSDMAPDKILMLYKKLVTDHAILEGKLLIMKATFFAVLQSEITKEAESQEKENPLLQAMSYLK